MASEANFSTSEGSDPGGIAALQHYPWRRWRGLSSGLDMAENFLGEAGFDRAPWLAVGFASGIGLWFELANRWQWLALVALCLAAAAGMRGLLRSEGAYRFSASRGPIWRWRWRRAV